MIFQLNQSIFNCKSLMSTLFVGFYRLNVTRAVVVAVPPNTTAAIQLVLLNAVAVMMLDALQAVELVVEDAALAVELVEDVVQDAVVVIVQFLTTVQVTDHKKSKSMNQLSSVSIVNVFSLRTI
jgi:hypothetical protein